MQTALILMRSEMGNFKIWTVALLALIVIVLSLAGPCNGTDQSTTTVSVIGSVAFDCNACSEHHLAFSGAHVAVKCHRGNDVSADGAGSMNDDGSFAVHLDKVELGDMCLAEVVMPNNKLCSLAKTSSLTPLEKLSVSTPLACYDTKTTFDQKLLLINFSKLHVKSEFLTVSKFLKPKYPSKPYFFKPKPLPKLPHLPPISKPKPFPKPKFFKPKPLPKFPPLPSIFKPQAILKPKFFTPLFPKLKFPPFPKLNFPPFSSPQPLPKLSPIPKLKLPPFPKLNFPPFSSPQPLPKLSPIPKLKLPPLTSPLPKLPPNPKFSKPPFPKLKLAPPPSNP